MGTVYWPLASAVNTGAMIQGTGVTNPPKAGVERWSGVFQLPLVRGWSGAIVGTEVPVTKKGTIKPTIEILEKVMGKGRWHPPEVDGSDRRWRGNEASDFEYAVARKRSWGWRLAVMERHPDALEVVDAWIEAAEAGDPTARMQLRRHLLAPGLAEGRRTRAGRILRRDPDAAELAVLGRLSDASVEEVRAADTIAWCRGLVDQAPRLIGMGDGAAWNGRPTLLTWETGAAVVAPTRGDALQCWWRRVGQPARFTVSQTLPDEAELELDRTAGRLRKR